MRRGHCRGKAARDEEDLRARSFTVTGLATDANDDLFGLGRARRELIFRNAVQPNYGIGRTIQQRENATARPYLMWDAINDSRTRDSHRAMDSHIAPMGAPVWRTWNAPAGHNCRCTPMALTEARARARGYPKLAPLAEPDKGWEGDPTEGNDDLVRVVQARRDAYGVRFAAKSRGRGLWCDDAGLQERLRLLQATMGNAPMTDDLLRRSLGADAFDRAALFVASRALPADVASAGLTLAEMVALHIWTIDTSPAPWFARINAMMRMADLSPGELEAVLPVAHALLSGLRKMPPFEGTVYRAIKERPMGKDAFEQFVREHETLPEVYHSGFVGASTLESGTVRGRAKFRIESRTGRDISSFSAKPEQREVLFAPPLRLAPQRVIKDGKVVRIWVNEI